MKNITIMKLIFGLNLFVILLFNCSEDGSIIEPVFDDTISNDSFQKNESLILLDEIVYFSSINIIYTINSNGVTSEVVAQDIQGEIKNIFLSPVDSRILIFRFLPDKSSFNIYELDILKSKFDNITKLNSGNISLESNSPVYSSDGRKIFLNMLVTESNNTDIFEVSLEDNVFTNLTKNFNSGDTNPTHSPDGTKIAFTSFREIEAGQQIYVMNNDGFNQVRISGNIRNAQMPAWSPDGTKLAYTEDNELYIVNSDGTGRTKIVDKIVTNGSNWWPSWSPAGDKIAFQLAANDDDINWRSGIYLINPDGTNITRLTETSVVFTKPKWSPNGSQLVFDGEPFFEGIRSFTNNIKSS